jgi:Astacin (Peptidase family M12A)
VEKVLAEAKTVVVDISSQRSLAIDIVTSMRQLTPQQVATLQASSGPSSGMARADARGKLWQAGATLRVRLFGGDAKAHEVVKAAAAEWSRHANLRFEFVSSGLAQVRIRFEPGKGSWSYLGTDALGIAGDQETMNLGFVDQRTALHEFGHVLGLIEEHLNPSAEIRWNRELIVKALSGPPNFWSGAQIDANVFRKFEAKALPPYRPFDPKSIMNMSFDPSWTGGLALGQGDELSDSDKALVARLYPR